MPNQIHPYESHFCFNLRLILKHYEEYTNSINEGTNCALKYSSVRVGPCTNFGKVLVIMCNNAVRIVKEKANCSS